MRRVTVMGMGRSGVAAAELALRDGAAVTCTDMKPEVPMVPGSRSVYGRHDAADFKNADLVVVSPGIPARHPLLQAAQAAGVEVVSELGFAFGHLDIPVLAVTGTNGKSTTTHLLGQVLRQAGFRPFVGGNLGTALSTAVGGDFDVAVVEVSSYQLELPGAFHAAGAALLNLQPDHLGRHGTLEVYAETKWRVFQRMGPEDWAIVGQPAEGVPWPLSGLLARRIELLFPRGGVLVLEGHEISLVDFPLLGGHNATNLAAALLLAMRLGVDPRGIRLAELQGLPHRLETVVEGPVRFIDDSKATNVDAALIGIGSVVPHGQTVVLLGGEGKEGADYARLLPALAGASVVCFGRSGPEIARALGGPRIVGTLREAVEVGRAIGGTVLLSPACASFDEFKNFEHRGQMFRAWARGEET